MSRWGSLEVKYFFPGISSKSKNRFLTCVEHMDMDFQSLQVNGPDRKKRYEKTSVRGIFTFFGRIDTRTYKNYTWKHVFEVKIKKRETLKLCPIQSFHTDLRLGFHNGSDWHLNLQPHGRKTGTLGVWTRQRNTRNGMGIPLIQGFNGILLGSDFEFDQWQYSCSSINMFTQFLAQECFECGRTY